MEQRNHRKKHVSAMYFCWLILAIFVVYYDVIDALSCATCSNLTDVRNCRSFSTCRNTERCYTTAYGTGKDTVFELGCMSETDCFSASAISVVGKRSSGVHCSQCCTVNECNTKLCSGIQIHGGWSTWNVWGACSHTCGMGTKSRHRTCDNPTPALAGNHCFGDASEYQACFIRGCIDGVWSSWSSWSNCTGGIQSKYRTCDNPAPSTFGKGCIGHDTVTKRCGPVAFTVFYQNGGYVNSTFIFDHVITNIGNGYDVTSGHFTCDIAGVYLFSLSLEVWSRNEYVYCYVRKNGANVTFVRVQGEQGKYFSESNSVYLSLSRGDIVDVGNCDGQEHISPDSSTSFSGALI